MDIQQVVVTGQHQAELQDLTLDTANLGPEEILVETEYSYISTGTELANYTGREPKAHQPGQWCTYPWKSGYANVGRVVEKGPSVGSLSVGDRVFTYGPHASAFRYATTSLAVGVPGDLDPAIAAASRMAGVATTSVIAAEIANDPWVVVYGLGMVGNLAAQAFGILGCRVIGVDPVDARRALAERCGVPYTVGGSPSETQSAIEDITDGGLAGITVDAVGHSAVVMQALRATASHGQIVILGSPRVPVEGNLTELLSEVHLRWITVRGALEWSLPMYPVTGGHVSQYSKQQMIFGWLARGKMQLEPLVSHRMAPVDIKEAYDGLEHEPNIYTGVLLDWSR